MQIARYKLAGCHPEKDFNSISNLPSRESITSEESNKKLMEYFQNKKEPTSK